MIRFVPYCPIMSMIAGLALLPVIGCGPDDGIGKRYPVSGTVTYQGKPVPRGTVTFTPESTEGRPAAADIDPDGSYTATTATPGDGMLPGKYRVSIHAVESDMSVVKGKVGGTHRVDLIAKAPKKALVPSKYADPSTSQLTVEVKPESNTFDFKLTD
jgi:hypothetical protein